VAPSGAGPHPLELLAHGGSTREAEQPISQGKKKMMATKTERHSEQDLLGVYLNDHLASATAGLELVRRMAASAEPGSETAAVVTRLANEITADRSALITMMAAVGVKIRGYKVLAARAGEKAGRLKLNGRMLSRSPLSALEETEMLRLGVEGKATGWRTLRVVAERDSRLDTDQLDELLARANRQSDTLEGLRVHIAERVLTGDSR
jgi:hypothetical protein